MRSLLRLPPVCCERCASVVNGRILYQFAPGSYDITGHTLDGDPAERVTRSRRVKCPECNEPTYTYWVFIER